MSNTDIDHSQRIAARDAAIAATMDDIRAIESDLGVTRDGVMAIRDRLIELANDRSLFSADDYPAPGADERVASRLYRIAQDADDRFVLYANASRGATSSPVHNHTTWAVVVGFDGQELNRFHRRTDDGTEQFDEHMVEAGTGRGDASRRPPLDPHRRPGPELPLLRPRPRAPRPS